MSDGEVTARLPGRDAGRYWTEDALSAFVGVPVTRDGVRIGTVTAAKGDLGAVLVTMRLDSAETYEAVKERIDRPVGVVGTGRMNDRTIVEFVPTGVQLDDRPTS